MQLSELLSQAIAALGKARNCTDTESATHLAYLMAELQPHQRDAARLEAMPLVFRPANMPGYIQLGRQGSEVTCPDPGLPGLEDAWRIFFIGVAVQDILHAEDIVGDDCNQPGNALRNRLAKAAEWIEGLGVPGCREIAQAMRRPSISISSLGIITAGPRPRILL